jgi:hypothetical protein
MTSLFGGFLEFQNQESLTEYGNQLNKLTSIELVEYAIEYALRNGAYSLNDAFCLYKCLETIKKDETKST